jgi:ATP-dependent DNA helicase RecG
MWGMDMWFNEGIGVPKSSTLPPVSDMILPTERSNWKVQMKEKRISERDYQEMALREESHVFDHKAFSISGKGVQKIGVAFANADGGDFIVGIADVKESPDVNLRWQGHSIEDFNGHIQALSEITPTLFSEYTLLSVEGRSGHVLLVAIEKSAEVHRTAAGLVYQRKGAQSLKLTDDQIQELSFAKGATSFEDYTVSSTRAEEVFESKQLATFLGSYAPHSEPLEFVLNQNLIDRTSLDPRVAGIVLFCDNPPAFMPRKCSVRITRYTTKNDDPERDSLESSETLEAPLYPLIKQAVEKVTSIMSSVNVWTVSGLKTLEYPSEAIWEIIANAFIHRDYSISDDIQILIFNDRIEVLSPGRLPGHVTPENILNTRFARNSKIVRTLSRYPNPPNRDLGEGLNTAFQKMKDWKLRPPQISQDDSHVRVVIPHISLASATDAILEFLQHHDTITNRQAREMTGIRSENAMKNEFYKLRDRGRLEMVPDKKGSSAAWQLPNSDQDGDDQWVQSQE